MKKRLINLLLALVMILGMIPATTLTANAVSAATIGTGTEADLYLVTTYTELVDLMRKSGTAYIKLNNNITHNVAAGDSDELCCIEVLGTKYLDLNGYQLTRVDYGTFDDSMINVRGTLTINDSSKDMSGAIFSKGKYMCTAIRVDPRASLVMNAGYIYHESSLGHAYSAITSEGNLTINGGEIYSQNIMAVEILAGTCNIYDGIFNSLDNNGIWLKNGTTHIYGGYYGGAGGNAIDLNGELLDVRPNLYIHNAMCYGSVGGVNFGELEITNLVAADVIRFWKTRGGTKPPISTFLTDGAALFLDGVWSDAADDTYVASEIEVKVPKFTTQPEGGEVVPGEKLTVKWELNFTPVKIRIMQGSGEIPTNHVSYLGDATATSMQLESSSYGYFICAFYNDTDYVASNKFYVKKITPAFTTQPEGGEVAPGEKLNVSWGFNFTPVRTVLVTFTPGTGGALTELGTNVTSAELGASPEGGYYQIRGYYNDEDFVWSDQFYVTEKKSAFVNPFTDVKEGDFFYDPVVWAVENGITNGVSEMLFGSDQSCLRAHVVTFLHRAVGNPEPASANNPFTDVKPSDFFYKPVLWAVEKGITNGISATQFGSANVCNRASVVTFLWRAMGSPEPETVGNPFVDVKSTDFFYKAVLWAVENKSTNGVDATHFSPAGTCNRAQVVTFLYRAYN